MRPLVILLFGYLVLVFLVSRLCFVESVEQPRHHRLFVRGIIVCLFVCFGWVCLISFFLSQIAAPPTALFAAHGFELDVADVFSYTDPVDGSVSSNQVCDRWCRVDDG